MEENTEFSPELVRRIVEFEAWCRSNNSTSLIDFAEEKQLEPEVIEGLERCQQMENDLSRLVGADDIASSQNNGGDFKNRVIGQYHLQEKLGLGGMGMVWLAHQSHPMKRRVAVKLIRSDRDSVVTARRFEREKQALALMSHAHVAQVFEAGMDDDGRPYIAMEYVDGKPLTQYCQNRQSSLTVRLELFLQLCSAIQHAHQIGLLHRDIKPDNILVTEIDGKPVVKVIDFGLVRPSETRDPQITDPDMVVGSPLWMSPEQAGGLRSNASKNSTLKTVDTRADVYSLGVILYQLLTDSTPISKEYYERATKLELLQTIQNEVPELPSERVRNTQSKGSEASTPASGWGTVLRNELDWVTMRALEKERDRRYPSVASFADDVKNYLQNEPVTARPPSFSYRLKKLAQKHKTATLSAISIMALVGLFSIGMLWFATQASKQATLAQKAEQRRGRAMLLMSKLFNPSTNGAKFNQSQLEILDEFRSEIDADDYSDDPQLEAEFRKFLADSYSGSAEYDLAVEQFERVIEIYETHDSDRRNLVRAKLRLAEEHSLHFVPEKALPLAKQSLDETMKQFGESDQLTIASKVMTNRVLLPTGNKDKIISELKNTVALAESELGESHPTTIDAMSALVEAYQLNHRHGDAAELIEPTLVLAKAHFGPNDRRTMDLRIRRLRILSRLGKIEALELDSLLSESVEKFGKNHLFSIQLRQEKVTAELSGRDFDSAEKQLIALIDDCVETFGRTHAKTMRSRDLLGLTYYMKARFDAKDSSDLDSFFDQSCKIRSELVADYDQLNLSDSKLALKAKGDLASVLIYETYSKRDYERALTIAQQAFPKSEKLLGFDSQVTQILLDARLSCLMGLDRQEEAMRLGVESYQKSLRDLEQPSLVTGILASWLGDVSVLRGQRKEACKYYENFYQATNELQTASAPITLMGLAYFFNEQAYLRDFEAAEKNARKLIETMPKTHPLAPKLLHAANVTIGESLCERGMFNEGRTILEELANQNNSDEKIRFSELRAQSALALCLVNEGKRSEAIANLRSARDEMKELEAEMAIRFVWFLERCEERLAELVDGAEKTE